MTRWGAVATAAASVVTAVSAATAGTSGAIVALVVLWLVTLMGIRLRLPPTHPRPAPRSARSVATPHTVPTYQDVERRLWPAADSLRMFDHATRPLLTRITEVLLRDRAGVDLAAEPERARALLGAAAWTLVDPARPPSDDSHSPGIALGRIDELLTRLEEL